MLTVWSNSIAETTDVEGRVEDGGADAVETVDNGAGAAVGEGGPPARLDDRSFNAKYAVAGTATPMDAARNRRLVYDCWEGLRRGDTIVPGISYKL